MMMWWDKVCSWQYHQFEVPRQHQETQRDNQEDTMKTTTVVVVLAFLAAGTVNLPYGSYVSIPKWILDLLSKLYFSFNECRRLYLFFRNRYPNKYI